MIIFSTLIRHSNAFSPSLLRNYINYNNSICGVKYINIFLTEAQRKSKDFRNSLCFENELKFHKKGGEGKKQTVI